MDAETIVTLRMSNLEVRLSPSIGGAIEAFEFVGDARPRAILRESHTRLEKVLDAACFPLVPYVNRIRGGRFRFRGREIRLAPNMAGDPSPLHGQGWLNPWSVDECRDRRAVLSYRHAAGEWPWDYDARQEFALDEHGLTATLTCRNASQDPMPCGLGFHPYFPCGPQTRLDTDVRAAWTVDEHGLTATLTCRNSSQDPMPCGLGFHPYFPCGPQTRLDTDVSVAWTVDEHVLPVNKVPAEGRYDLKHRLVCGQDLDNGFGGWGGEARMSDPGWPYAIRMSSDEARFFQLYSPPAGGIFVAEPVTHANAALNAPEEQWPELGIRVLDPGEEMSLTMRLEVEARRTGAG
jgi:aldose 1-epimerase